VFALAVCNTVVPVLKAGGLSYKVASQDELAFVTAAARLGVTLTTRQGQTLGEEQGRTVSHYRHSGRDCQLNVCEDMREKS
jgi:magnesium-transporting ATPase (P-type)